MTMRSRIAVPILNETPGPNGPSYSAIFGVYGFEASVVGDPASKSLRMTYTLRMSSGEKSVVNKVGLSEGDVADTLRGLLEWLLDTNKGPKVSVVYQPPSPAPSKDTEVPAASAATEASTAPFVPDLTRAQVEEAIRRAGESHPPPPGPMTLGEAQLAKWKREVKP